MSWGVEEKEKDVAKEEKEGKAKSTPSSDSNKSETEEKVEPDTSNSPQKQENKYNFAAKSERDNYMYLLYGGSSSGKTYTSLTFPEKTIIIDTENRAGITKRECFPDKKIHIFKPKVLLDEMGEHGKVLDYRASLEKLNNFVLDLVKDVKEGNIDINTVIVDSMSDVWAWCINWAQLKLVDKVNKDGSKKVDIDMLHFNNQMNWFMPKDKHQDIFEILKVLTNYGIDIVFTARRKPIPEYVKEKENVFHEGWEKKVRSEKRLPYNCDIVIRQVLTKDNRRKAVFEKCYKEGVRDTVVENLIYDKIREVLK